MSKLTDIGQAICLSLATAGTAICSFLGGWDMPLQVLIVVIIIDYITGIICAIIDKKLNSEVGFKGIAKKIFILLLVALAVLIDRIANINILRNLTIIFYFCNEAISILENTTKLGIPYPQKIKDILEQLKNGGDKNTDVK